MREKVVAKTVDKFFPDITNGEKKTFQFKIWIKGESQTQNF